MRGEGAAMRRRHARGEGARKARRQLRLQQLREHRRRGIFLLPSLLTTGNLFCGFLALVLTAQQRFTEAAVAVFVAMLLDILDGRVARLTNTTTQFGVEFDSLADVVSFCVAPGLHALLAGRSPSSAGRRGSRAFLFVICGALRLARFNVYSGVSDRRFFVGLPDAGGGGHRGGDGVAARSATRPSRVAGGRRSRSGRTSSRCSWCRRSGTELQGDRLRAAPPGQRAALRRARRC